MKAPLTTTSTESYAAFRRRLLLETLLPSFFLPPLFVALLVQVSVFWQTHAPKGLAIPRAVLYIASVPLWFAIRIQMRGLKHRRESERLGARIVPRLRGKWPGNIDILLRIMRAKRTHYVMDWAKEMMEETGSMTINTNILWENHYLTMDQNVVKFILATGFEQFDKGVGMKERMEDAMGNSIFNRDGEIWKAHRTLTRPFFARERLIDCQYFEKFTQKTLEVLANHPTNKPIDLQDLFARFTMDTGAAFLFDTDLNTLSLPLPEAYKAGMGPKGSASDGSFGSFASAFEELQYIVSTRIRRGMLWKYFEIFRNASDAPMKTVREYLDPIVLRAIEEKEKYKALTEEEKAEMSGSFLHYLAMSTEDVGTIRHELITMLGASRDTTTLLLASAVYAFTQHPDVLTRLREEVMNICPRGHTPTYDDIRQLKYLRAVLHETLRLFPPAAINTCTARSRAVAVPGTPSGNDVRPWYIPAKAAVTFVPILIQKRQDLWGPDTDVFDPGRWLDERMGRVVKNPFMFTPFHAGPRICIGQQFALNEASFFLIRLLQNYDGFELALDAQPEGSLPPAEWAHIKGGRASVDKVWYSSSLTMYIKGGLWVKPHRVEDGDL